MTDTPDGTSLVDDARLPPFCFQTHAALAVIRATFSGAKLTTALAVYLTLTEAANRSGGVQARNGFSAARTTIADAAGISADTLDRYVKAFVKAGLLAKQRRDIEGVQLPNRWALLDPAPTPPGSRTDAGTGSRTDAAQEQRTTTEEESSSPLPPGRELAVQERPANWPATVNRKAVTEPEYEQASSILEVFNQAAHTRYVSKDYVAKIVSRIREHPDLDLAAHGAVIAASLTNPWWSGDPSPSVIYGNAALFERCLHAAASRSDAPGDRGLTPDEIATYGIKWGPGTPYDSLMQAQAAPHADIELDASEVEE